jgi:hypothetical protein
MDGAQRGGAAFAGFETKCVEDREDENLAITGVAGVGGGINSLQDAFDFLVVANDLQAHLPRQFGSGDFTIFRMAHLVFLAEAADLRNAQAVDVFKDKGILYPVQDVG